MKRKLSVSVLSALFVMVFAVSALAAQRFSDCFVKDASGNWKVKDVDGKYVTNAWVRDDAAGGTGWYFFDVNGNMLVSPLVQDTVGRCYSFETDPNGNYGELRTQPGTYDGIFLDIETSDTGGTYGSIKNADGIEAMKEKYGMGSLDTTRSGRVFTSEIVAYQKRLDQPVAAPALAKMLSDSNKYSDMKYSAKGKTVYVDCYTADSWKDMSDAMCELLLEMTWGSDDAVSMYRELSKNAKDQFKEDVTFCLRGYRNGRVIYTKTYDESVPDPGASTVPGNNPLIKRRTTASPFKK